MRSDTILSFSAPLAERRHIQVRPSAVLELTYAYYFLLKRLDRDRDSNLPWVKQLRENAPAGLEGLRTVWRTREMENLGYELFVLACWLGYATDPKPNRFLSDFPSLPGRILDGLEEITEPNPAVGRRQQRTAEEREQTNSRLRRHFEVLSEPAAAVEMQSALSALWAHLEPAWEREGRSVSETACSLLESEIAGKGELLEAL